MNKVKVKSITIAEKIYIKKQDVEDSSALLAAYTYNNGDEFLSTIEETEEYFLVPSNSYHKLEWDYIEDKRNFNKLDGSIAFTGTLRPEQQEAVDKFFIGDRARSGLLQAPPGFGKTFAACNLISRNNTKTLILTHTKLLFEQWHKELSTQLSNVDIGLIGDGKFTLGDVTIAIYKTAYNNIEKLQNEFSTVIVDECLDYETQITTRTGKIKLGKIVNNKLEVEVLTYNIEKSIFEYKKVYDWFKSKQETLIAIGNDAHIVKGTENHNVYVYQDSKIIKKPISDVTLNDYLVSNKTNTSIEAISLENHIEPFSLQKVKYKYPVAATSGYRYNISVSDNHNYIANNILVGNCHKAPADMFSSVVNNINAKIKIGLSATPRRKDGKHVYLPDFFSPYLVIAKDSRNLAIPSVTIVPTDFKFPITDPKRDWARAMNKICADKDYQTLIANTAISYIKQKRCPLIIGDRVQMLKDLQKLIPDSICVIGESDNAVREDALNNLGKTYKAILTTKLFDEGISCHRLDTLFFTCPSNNPVQWEQRIGRIERLHPEKQFPLIVDFWLSGKVVSRQQQARLLWYQSRGYNLI
jgi:superfamily II DNA or RNA helicase